MTIEDRIELCHLLEDMRKDKNAAKKLGLSNKSILKELRTNGIRKVPDKKD